MEGDHGHCTDVPTLLYLSAEAVAREYDGYREVLSHPQGFLPDDVIAIIIHQLKPVDLLDLENELQSPMALRMSHQKWKHLSESLLTTVPGSSMALFQSWKQAFWQEIVQRTFNYLNNHGRQTGLDQLLQMYPTDEPFSQIARPHHFHSLSHLLKTMPPYILSLKISGFVLSQPIQETLKLPPFSNLKSLSIHHLDSDSLIVFRQALLDQISWSDLKFSYWKLERAEICSLLIDIQARFDVSKLQGRSALKSLCFVGGDQTGIIDAVRKLKHDSIFLSRLKRLEVLFQGYANSLLASALAKLLKANGALLEELHFRYSYMIDRSDCQRLSAAITSTLKMLSLRDCVPMANPGMLQLIHSLKSCSFLEYLDLSKNYIRDEGAMALIPLMQKVPLASLCLSGCALTLAGGHGVLSYARDCPSLTRLNISCNNLSGGSIVSDLAALLHASVALTSVDLSDNSLGEGLAQTDAFRRELTQLGAKVAASRILWRLDLSANKLRNSALHLCASVADNWTDGSGVAEVRLQDNCVSAETVEDLATSLTENNNHLLQLFGLNTTSARKEWAARAVYFDEG